MATAENGLYYSHNQNNIGDHIKSTKSGKGGLSNAGNIVGCKGGISVKGTLEHNTKGGFPQNN